ncbi:MAG: hypothetical protein R3257_05550, partial [bacterium]|nr:hypothetical protein [bacterium]
MTLRLPQLSSWILGILLIFIIFHSGCSTSSFGGDGAECDPGPPGVPGECPSIQQAGGGNFAQFCEALPDGSGVCTNVCAFAANQVGNVPPGKEGDFCVFDSDCGENLTCDNDTVGAEMPCHCIPDSGAAPGVNC